MLSRKGDGDGGMIGWWWGEGDGWRLGEREVRDAGLK